MIIPKVNFYLKNIKSIEPTLIYLQVKFNNERMTMSALEKIIPNDWDFLKQRVIQSKNNKSSSDINIWINKIEFEFNQIFRNLRMDNIVPTALILKEKMEISLNIKKTLLLEKNPELIPFIKILINQNKSLKSEGTIKSYNTSLNHLINYSKYNNIKELFYNNIDLNFYNSFVTYISVVRKTSINNAGKQIKNLKYFLNEATDRGYNKNLDFKKKSFRKLHENVDKIFLTENEINQINETHFQNETFNIVKEYFIISCYTGLRYSDLKNLKKECIVNGRIEIVTTKTKEKVIIPIKPIIKSILDKYNNILPKLISNQKFNDYLKIIGEKANINTSFSVTKEIANKSVIKVFKKYELLSCHTGRRSFASNAIINKIPSEQIRQITGHKSESSFKLYVRLDKKDFADLLEKTPFFMD